MSKQEARLSTPQEDFSTTATLREVMEALAEESVIISVPVEGDASEFE